MFQNIRRFLIVVFLLVSLVLALLGWRAYEALHYLNPENVTVFIPKGSSIRKIAGLLKENNVIENEIVFELYLRFSGMDKKLKSGEYEIPAQATIQEVSLQIAEGRVKQYKFTIPEGSNIRDVCRILVNQKLMDALLCASEVRRVDLIKNHTDEKTLEGYLFPETYLYERDTKPTDFIPQMVKMFYKKVPGDFETLAKDKGFTLRELVTFASIIEKETANPVERSLIASVFYNRLKIGMLLQTDPTVIYGIENFNGNLRRSDLEKDTPYNTYTRAGLPIGPICNPGLAALDAVLHPVQSDYLYFVAKGGGNHYFSKTLEEHNQAVREFQLNRNSP